MSPQNTKTLVVFFIAVYQHSVILWENIITGSCMSPQNTKTLVAFFIAVYQHSLILWENNITEREMHVTTEH